MSEDQKSMTRQGPPQLIPEFIEKRVTIRLLSGGQPLIGMTKMHNPYEVLFAATKSEIIIPKRAIAVIEMMEDG